MTGAIRINSGGVINIQHANALGNVSAATTVLTGGALEIQGGITTAAEPLTLNGTGVSSGGALRNISGNNTYAGAISLGSATRINSDSGTLTLSAAISGSFGVTFGGAGNVLLSSALGTGANTLTKDGTGKLILGATNTNTGITFINAGTLQIGNGGANGMIGSGNVTNNSILAFDRSDALAFTNSVAGSGSLVVAGGTIKLLGTNTYTGITTINTGSTLQIGDNAYGSVGTGDIINNGDLLIRFGPGFGLTLSNTISGTGGLTKQVFAGGDPLTLAATNSTYTGQTRIEAGNVAIYSIKNVGGGASSLGAPTTVANGTVVLGVGNPATLTYLGTGDTTDRKIEIAGATLAASPTIMQNGTGLLKLTGDFFASVDVNHNLTLNGTGLGEIAGTISDPATANTRIIKEGSGTWVLSGTNTFAGFTRISAGQLVLARDIAITNSSLQVQADNGLVFSNATSFLIGGLQNFGNFGLTNTAGAAVTLSNGNNNGNTTYSGVMSGSGSLVKIGTGRFTLSGTNTYTGTTTIGLGQLQLADGLALTNSTITVSVNDGLGFSDTTSFLIGGLSGANNFALTNATGAAVTLNTGNNNANTTFSGSMSGIGGLVKIGTGNFTLTGNNTYSGGTTVSTGTLVIANASGSAIGTGAGLVLSGATLSMQNGIINGGPSVTLTNFGSIFGTGVISNGIWNTSGGKIMASNGILRLLFQNNQNAGTLSNFNSAATLFIQTNVLVNTSTGVIALNSGGLVMSGSVLTNQGVLVGPGNFSSSLFNDTSGTVTAALGVLNIATNGAAEWVQNQGVMSIVSGGTLSLQGATAVNLAGGLITNSGGALYVTGVFSNRGDLVLRNGATMTNAAAIFFDSGATGRVDGAGSVWSNTANNIILGNNTGSSRNALLVTNGGQFIANQGTLGRLTGGANNLLLVSGISGTSTSTVSFGSTGAFVVGDAGSNNTVVVSAGGQLIGNGDLKIGNAASARTNLVLVTDAGSIITNRGALLMGGFGNTLVVSNGGLLVTVAASTIGSGASNAMVIVTGNSGNTTSTWNLGNTSLTIGSGAADGNALLISGGIVTNVITVQLGAAGTATGNSLILTNGAKLFTGGTVTRVIDGSGNTFSVAGGPGGVTSTWDGGGGAFTLGQAANNSLSNNVLTIGAGGIFTNIGAAVGTPSRFNIGSAQNNLTAAGNQVSVANGGQLWTLNNLNIGFILNGTSTAISNSLFVDNALVNVAGALIVGNNSATGGRADFNNLTITNGGSLTSTSGTIGLNGNSNSVLIAGTNSSGVAAIWNTGNGGLTVGSGTSTGNVVTVADGGTVLANDVLISATTGDFGNRVNVTGGSLFVTNAATTARLLVGQAGSGTLTLSGGSIVADQLLVTNNLAGGATNSFFSFTGGALTTSNATDGVAANIKIASNSIFNINGTWNMTGGTNLITSVATGGSLGSTVVGAGGTVNVLNAGQLVVDTVYSNQGVTVIANTHGMFNGNVYNSGAFTLQSSATATTYNVYLDSTGSTISTASVTGASIWNVYTNLSLGNIGATSTGNLVVAGGSLFVTNAAQTGNLLIGGTGGGFVEVTNGVIVADQITLGGGAGGAGTLTVGAGGTVIGTNAGFVIGQAAGSRGLVNLDTGGTIVLTNLVIGQSGAGTFNFNGGVLTNSVSGAVNVLSGLTLGQNAGGTGAFAVAAGTFSVTNGSGTAQLIVGSGGSGRLTLDGGTLNANQILATNGTQSVLIFNGGTLNISSLFVTNGVITAFGDGAQVAVLNLAGGPAALNDGIAIANNATLTGNGTFSASAFSTNATGGNVIATNGLLYLGGGFAGGGQFRAESSGTLFLAASNTFTGPTIINGGQLIVGNENGAQNSAVSNLVHGGIIFTNIGAATFGGLAGTGDLGLTNTAGGSVALLVNTSATNSYTGVISGSGSFGKGGAGMLTFTQANTYAGGTTITNGALFINNLTGSGVGSGDVTIFSGGTLGGSGRVSAAVQNFGGTITPGDGGIGTFSVGTLSLAAGSHFNFELENLTSGDLLMVTNAGGLSFSNGVTFNINAVGGGVYDTPGRYKLIGYTNGFTGTYSDLSVGNPSLTRDYFFGTNNNFINLTMVGKIGWGGGGSVIPELAPTNNHWSVSTNWAGGVVPTPYSIVVFTGNAGLINTNDLTVYTPYSGIVFSNDAGAFILNGNAINLWRTPTGLPAVDNVSSNTQTFNIDLVMEDGSATINASNGSVVINGSIGETNGSFGLTKIGTNSLTLTGANTYSGDTLLSNGTLIVANATGSGTGTGAVQILNGTTLTLEGGSLLGTSLTNNGYLSGYGVISNQVFNNGTVLAVATNLPSTGTLTVNLANSTNSSTSTLGTVGTNSVLNLLPWAGGDSLVNLGTVSLSGGSLTLNYGPASTITNEGLLTGFGDYASSLHNAAAGTVNATNGTLALGGAGSSIDNAGTFQVQDGATLSILPDWNNTGTVAMKGGTLFSGTVTNANWIYGSGSVTGVVVNSGFLMASNGVLRSALNSFTNASASTIGTRSTNATFDVRYDGGPLQPLINLGTINLAGGTLLVNGNSTGTISNRPTGTLVGVGNITQTLINDGTIMAANPVSGLSIFSVGLEELNNGTIGASNGATLNVIIGGGAGSSFNNNGTISMRGGTLMISNATLGVTTNLSGAMVSGFGTIVPALANLGRIVASSGELSFGLLGDLNSGILSNLDSSATLRPTNSLVVNTGQIALNGGRLALLSSSGVISNAAGIFGPGIVANSVLNAPTGTIFATNGLLSIATNAGAAFSNRGLIDVASNSTLHAGNAWNNPDGTVVLQGGYITGGTLTNQGAVTGFGAIVSLLANASSGLLTISNGVLTLSNAPAQHGTFMVTNNGTLAVATAWNNAGTLTLRDGTVIGATVSNTHLITGYGTLTPRLVNNNFGTVVAAEGTLTLNVAPLQTGTFIVTNAGTLQVQQDWNNAGSVRFFGGTSIGGVLTNQSVLSGFGTITPLLVNTGGTVYAESGKLTLNLAPLQLGTLIVSNAGTLEIEQDWRNAGNLRLFGGTAIGGVLTNTAAISGFGTLTPLLVNTGGTVYAKSGTLTLDVAPVQLGTLVVSNAGTLHIQEAWSNLGTVSLRGGTVVGGALTNAPGASLLGFGTISSPALINSGTGFATSLSQVLHVTSATLQNQTNGVFGARFGRLVVDAIFTNAGTVSFLHGAGTFNSHVVNQGAWLSDPTTLTFHGDYTVATNAYISADRGDVYVFKSNFYNFSHETNQYNTLHSEFVFDGDLNQTQVFSVAGLNLGGWHSSMQASNEIFFTANGATVSTNSFTFYGSDNLAGFTNNFSLGQLTIGSATVTSTLELVDSFGLFEPTDNAVAGLYVNTLRINPGSLLIISNNVQLFYRNASGISGISVGIWDGSSSVLLLNGSSFHQINVVPEPSILLLLLIGGVAVYWRRRKTGS